MSSRSPNCSHFANRMSIFTLYLASTRTHMHRHEWTFEGCWNTAVKSTVVVEEEHPQVHVIFLWSNVVGQWSFGTSFTSGVGCKRWGVINVFCPCQGQLTDLLRFRADVLTSTAGRQRLWNNRKFTTLLSALSLAGRRRAAGGRLVNRGHLIHKRDWMQSAVLY